MGLKDVVPDIGGRDAGVAQNKQPLHDIAQLAYVAGPVFLLQQRHCLGAETLAAHAAFPSSYYIPLGVSGAIVAVLIILRIRAHYNFSKQVKKIVGYFEVAQRVILTLKYFALM